MAQPIRHTEVRDSGEFSLIGRDNGQVQRTGLGGDQEIIRSNECSVAGEGCPDFGVVAIGRRIERQYLECGKDLVDAIHEVCRARFDAAVTELPTGNDARADRTLTGCDDAFTDTAMRSADQIRENIGVQQVAQGQGQSSTSSRSGKSSSISGKFSVSGSRVSKSASSRPFCTGSMMRRSPSLRIMASSPSSSYSRGMRSA